MLENCSAKNSDDKSLKKFVQLIMVANFQKLMEEFIQNFIRGASNT